MFASVNDAQERMARDIVCEVMPDAAVTLSSSLGRLGLLERENAAIMNASLASMAGDVVASFGTALRSIGIDAPFFVSQNDGTLMAPELAARFPVLTFASGPTNSIRGGGLLSGLDDCIVVDIGGTTTDVGVLSAGFPRESSVAVDIGGVRTNFRMPDVLSIGLGGGSRVRSADGATTVGPDSVGFRLTSEALVFGGSTLTATDVAVASGRAQSVMPRGEVARSPLVDSALQSMRTLIEDAIDRMKTSASDIPVVLVGGGSILAHRDIRGASRIVVPEQAGVANAIGAAIAQVSGEVDQVFSYEELGRDGALQEAKRLAGERAVRAGAPPSSVRIVDVEELPMLYLPGGSVRVRVKAVGSLAALGGELNAHRDLRRRRFRARRSLPRHRWRWRSVHRAPAARAGAAQQGPGERHPGHGPRRRRARRAARRHGSADGDHRKDHRLRAKASACCVRSEQRLGRKATAIMSAEIGGLNALYPGRDGGASRAAGRRRRRHGSRVPRAADGQRSTSTVSARRRW